jgi:hypothetical protein
MKASTVKPTLSKRPLSKRFGRFLYPSGPSVASFVEGLQENGFPVEG